MTSLETGAGVLCYSEAGIVHSCQPNSCTSFHLLNITCLVSLQDHMLNERGKFGAQRRLAERSRC